jgi:prepilin-type N-terminal cleavage/methylation domain-containing protein
MIQRLRNQLSGARGNEAGYGLPELLVAMVLFSILAVLITTSFSSFTTTLTRDRVATANTNVAAVGMDELTRVIRSATTIPVLNGEDLPAFAYANKEKITLYAYIDTSSGTPAPVKVTFEVKTYTPPSGVAEARVLTETRWTASHPAGAPLYWEFVGAPSERVIARQIVEQTGTEPFLFNYQEINATTLLPADIAIPGTGIAAANLKKIAVVEVTIKVQTDTAVPARSAPVAITNQVGIPNLGVSRLSLS